VGGAAAPYLRSAMSSHPSAIRRSR
jgi:hypothetical protein